MSKQQPKKIRKVDSAAKRDTPKEVHVRIPQDLIDQVNAKRYLIAVKTHQLQDRDKFIQELLRKALTI